MLFRAVLQSRGSWIHSGSWAGKGFLQKAQAGGLGLGVSHGTRLVLQPQCSINADSCCHLYVSGAGLVQDLPLWVSISLVILVK